MRLIVQVLILCVGLCAGPMAHAQTDIAGWWRAEAEHEGEREPFYLHFGRDEQGRATARFTIPIVRMRDVFVGPFSVDGDRVEVPGLAWSMRLAANGAVLEGNLPHALVPQDLPVRFVRAEPPPPFEPLAPARAAPEPVWTMSVGAPVWGDLTFDRARSVLYVADESGAVTALSARDGALRWRTSLGASVRGAPALARGRLYVATDAALAAIEAGTGRTLWSAAFAPELAARLPMSDPNSAWDHYAASPVVDGGVVYVGSRDGCVYAIGAREGRLEWRTCLGALITAAPAVTRDALFVGAFDGFAYKLARDGGAVLWRRDTHGAIARDPLVVDSTVLFGSRSYDLIALDAHSGEPVWSRHFWFSWVDSTPVVDRGVVFVGGSDSLAVQALDAASGRRLWSAPLPGWAWARPAVGADAVYAGAAGGAPYLASREAGFASVDRATGRLRWLYRPAPGGQGELTGFASGPVVSGARVFAADLTGAVYAFEDTPG